MDKGFNSCTVFLDLAKAFDSVDHTILLKKLSRYGIKDNCYKLFESYLHERYQFVEINGIKSSLRKIDFGVPQGSILGPLLFLIFINDLPNATNFYIKLFADDTFLCSQNDDLKTLESDVNFEIEKVYSWLKMNKLTLNISKSKFMLISNKKRLSNNFSVSLNGQDIEQCDSYKYLGVIFDKNLNWKEHINYVCQKVSKACGALAKLRHCVNTNILKEFYHSLFHSYVKYGLIVWGNASKTNLKPLQVLMNRALRIITFSPFGNIDIKPLYDCLKIIDVETTFLLETGKFIYKNKKNMLPANIGNQFSFHDPSVVHSYNLRSVREPVFTFRLRSTEEKSIQIRGEKIWNQIPEIIKNSPSFASFKRCFKVHLLDQNSSL